MANKQFSMEFLLGGKLASSFDSAFKKAKGKLDNLRGASEQLNNISGKMAGGIAAIGGTFAAAAGGIGLFITSVNGANAEMANMSKAMGVSLDTTRAMGSMMESMGGNWENFTDLIEEQTNKLGELKATGEMKKFQEAIGLTNIEVKKLEKMNPEQQFTAITDSLLKMKDKQRAAFIADEIWGGEGNKFISMAREQGGSMAELMAQYNKYNLYTKDAQDQSAKFTQAMKPLTQIASSAKDQFAALLGGALTPMIKETSAWVAQNKELINQKLADYAKSFADSLKWVVDNFEDIVKWGKVIGTGVAVFMGLSAAIKAVTIVTTIFNAVLAVNPIVLIVAGVALLAAGIYYLINRMGGLTAVWENVKGAFSVGIGFIKSIIQSVDTFFAENPILNFMMPIIGVPRLIIAHWSSISGFFSTLWEGIKSIVSGAVTFLYTVVLNMPIVQAFKTVFNNVVAFLSTLKDVMLGIGKNIINGLIDGIMWGFDKLKSVWDKVNSWIPDFATKKMDIHSPSRVMAGIGENITAGLGVGIESGFPSVQTGMNSGMNSLMPNTNQGIQNNASSGSINLTQYITVGSGDAAEQAKKGAADGVANFMAQYKSMQQKNMRTSFG
jgi:hypothetical protein